MSAVTNDLFIDIHNLSMKPAERKEFLRGAEMFKVAGVAAIIAAAVLFAALPSLLTFCLLAPIAYVGYETATIANNSQNIVENWLSIRTFVDGFKEGRNAELIKRATERAPVARAIARLSGLV